LTYKTKTLKGQVIVKKKGKRKIMPIKECVEYVKKAMKGNKGSSFFTLGKWIKNGKYSYEKVGVHLDTMYYQLDIDLYHEIVKKYGEGATWVINRLAINDMLNAGKIPVFSHNPAFATGTFAKEVKYIGDWAKNLKHYKTSKGYQYWAKGRVNPKDIEIPKK
jgi:hypothetical protein